MKRIDFKHFCLYRDITKTEKETVDVSEAFANIIYSRTTGIRAHELLMRIYRDGETEVSEDDAGLITSVAHRYCTPAFIDVVS
jgi:hypothetical protein